MLSRLLDNLSKMVKSKTIVGNSLAAAVVTVLTYFEVEVSVEVVTAMFLLGNVILRFFTVGSLEDK